MIDITNTSFINGTGGQDESNDNPLLFYKSVIRPEDVTNALELTAPSVRPAANMWTPDTATSWMGPSGDSLYIIGVENYYENDVDYIAFSGHNLSSADRPGWLTVQVYESTNGTGFTQVTDEIALFSGLGGEVPFVAYFNTRDTQYFQIWIRASSTIYSTPNPVISHVRLGEATILQRREFVGTQMMVEKQKRESRYSETGQFLGNITMQRYRDYSINQTDVTYGHVENRVIPFIDYVNKKYDTEFQQETFFYAPRPTSRPNEVIYGWTDDNIQPEFTRGSNNPVAPGIMNWSCNIKGIK